MKLKKLQIKKYKNLIDFTVDFESGKGLSILIGNNGSGKSNVLEAISGIFVNAYSAKAIHKFVYSLTYPFFTPILVKMHAHGNIHLLNCVPIASMETVRMLFFMTRRLKVGGKTLRGKISIIMSNVPTIGKHEQRRYKLFSAHYCTLSGAVRGF